MSTIKSYAVGNGDMFYIEHGSDNFTIIDCCLNEDVEQKILTEISEIDGRKGITRFISTHPDEDHVRGLEKLHEEINIRNFYCVKNKAIKEDESESFLKYCELRDTTKAFHISKGCSRRWMNNSSEARKSAGIDILWPDLNNSAFLEAMAIAERGGSPNNISAIVKYKMGAGRTTAIWMGDLETDFMTEVEQQLELPKVNILFAPHHGRFSGKIPSTLLAKMDPKIIVIGEAPSEHLHYYDGYNIITQNSAGDIIFDCRRDEINVFTSNPYDVEFLEYYNREFSGHYYVGTLNL